DLRYAGRTLLRGRGFAVLALLSLALGIGANTVIYSFMDAILLRTLPVPDADSLALVNWHSKIGKGPRPNHVVHGMDGSTWKEHDGTTSGVFPYGAYELLSQGSVFSTLFAYYPTEQRTLSVRGEAASAEGEYVSGGYFSGLGVGPVAGRLIAPEDDRVGAPLV